MIMEMEKEKLYLITFGKKYGKRRHKFLPIHSMVIQFTEYCVKDNRRFMKYETVAHTTDKGISLIRTRTRYLEPQNIDTCEPVDRKELPLYIGWTTSIRFDELLKGDV